MRLAFLLAALALGACRESETSFSRTQLIAEPLPVATTEEWTALTPRAAEIDGRLIEATCSGAPGADPAYSFFAKRGTADGLVVYFDGGGACWDDITCSVPRLAENPPGDGFYKAELIPGDDPATLGGIFDLANPDNPVRDWSFVFVPYCTGDVHAGTNTAQYRDADSGEAFSIEHRGADNFRLVLEWMRANFDAPEHILIAGSSAGAYGAATHYGRIREAFPSGRATFLGDAGQGVTTPEFLSRRNSNWRYDLPTSVFGPNPQLTDDDDIVGILAERYPNDRFGQYTTAQDRTQQAFYALMGAGNACQAWTDAMVADLERRQAAANFRSYLATGRNHTILRSRAFYTEVSGGASFAEWVGALLSENGEGWDNRACQDCTTSPTRCTY